MKTFANEQADWFIQECDSAYGDMIAECVDHINGRMCDALDDGVAGKEFEDAAYEMVKQTAEVLVGRVGVRVGKDLCGIMHDIFIRMAEAPCGHTAVCVDAAKQHVSLNREDNLQRKRVFWVAPINGRPGVVHASLTEAEVAEMQKTRKLFHSLQEAALAAPRKVFWVDYSGDGSVDEAFLTESEIAEKKKTETLYDTEEEACEAVRRLRELREIEQSKEE